MRNITAALEITAVSKRYRDVQAVRELSFTVAPGETYGLLGPNGAGKSTAISMAAGLVEPDAGEISVFGRPMTTRSVALRSEIGLVPQEVAVYPDLTARENLAFFGRLYEIGGADLDRRVDHVLEVIGLGDRADDRASEYSGGMSRRLNIGLGLLHEPRLLILDEPTVGVDPQSRNAILDAVEDLSAAGLAVLYTTHYMEEAERLCDRIGIIDEGELKAEGTVAELTRSVGEKDGLVIGATAALDRAVAAVSTIEGVRSASVTEDGLSLLVDDASAVVTRVLDSVARAGSTIDSVAITTPDLEAVFMHVTGRALRD